MDHSEIVTLLRDAVPAAGGGVWAELGAGTGNFTWALAELLGSAATIWAVDRDLGAITALGRRMIAAPAAATIVPRQADFTQWLGLPDLDGVLLANALHFVADQPALLRRVVARLKPGGRLVVAEYDVTQRLRYVPYPVPFGRLAELAAELELPAPRLAGRRRSPSSGIDIYVGVVA